MSLQKLFEKFPLETTLVAQPRPYVNHSVEFKVPNTVEQRLTALEKVGWNVFYFPAELTTGCDMLSDSGTTTMTNEQWASLHLGDEAYGSNRGYFKLLEQIATTFGETYSHVYIFHQGRSAEDTLFTALGTIQPNQVIPSNGHFDTTHANIEANGMEAKNLFSPTLRQGSSTDPFKGNMDIERLRALLEHEHQHVPIVYVTVTNNTGGGQPVAMANIKAVAELAHQYDLPFFLDACRFAENAWFIQQREAGYHDKSIVEIVREMFSYADGFTISFKKDGLGNMGGGIILKRDGQFVKKYPHLPDQLMNDQILKEGHPTYGGLSGRDIMALAVGLRIVTTQAYLDHRIRQVEQFGQSLHDAGIPVVMPFGGHAVYLDMNRFFADTRLQPGDFGGIAFTALLLGLYGHRACELGNFAFGTFDSATKQETFPEVNFVRCAIPRLRYETQDLQAVTAAIQALYEQRHSIPAVDVLHGKDLPLRHFKARFQFRPTLA